MKISIITVCLNSEKTIEQTIESVLNQEYEELEYIIVDGKSTDTTMEIVNRYSDRIHIIVSEQDEGLYHAMNKGICLATGDIIGILNSDDWYEPNILYDVAKCFEETDVELLYGVENLYRDGELVEVRIPKEIEELRYTGKGVPHPTVFMKKEIYRQYGMFDTKYAVAADFELLLRLYVKGVKFACLDKPITNFRLSGISTQRNDLCVKEATDITLKYLPEAPIEKQEQLRERIIKRYKSFMFSELLTDSCQHDYLCNKIFEKRGDYDEIVIFGAGSWGRSMFKILHANNLSPRYIVDNNYKQWNTEIDNIPILDPAVLADFRGMVLIMVKDFSREIVSQISEMNNHKLRIVSWEDFVDGYEDN